MKNLLATLVLLSSFGSLPALGQTAPSSFHSEDSAPYVVDVKALDYAFGMPTEVPSGWVTFRMENMGAEEHIALLQQVPDTLDLETVQTLIHQRAPSGVPKVGPGQIRSKWVAGVGMLSSGRTAQTTVYLEPGVYLMWCTVDTPDGEDHADKGMIRAFRVTEQPVREEKPETDIRITLSDFAISTDGPIGAGTHTFDVQFLDPGLKDVFVARLKEGQTVEDVLEWMEAFRAPSPFDFLGGTEQMPGIFQVDLEPGRYALVSHQGAHAGLAEEVVIPENGQAPAISNEPVNPPVVVTLPSTTPVLTVPAGRTLVTFDNHSESRALYQLHQVRPDFTEDDYYDFVQPAGLVDRVSESEPQSVPFYYVIPVYIGPGERRQYNLDLREGTYFLFPISEEHFFGERALSSSELEAIKKIEVR